MIRTAPGWASAGEQRLQPITPSTNSPSSCPQAPIHSLELAVEGGLPGRSPELWPFWSSVRCGLSQLTQAGSLAQPAIGGPGGQSYGPGVQGLTDTIFFRRKFN